MAKETFDIEVVKTETPSRGDIEARSTALSWLVGIIVAVFVVGLIYVWNGTMTPQQPQKKGEYPRYDVTTIG